MPHLVDEIPSRKNVDRVKKKGSFIQLQDTSESVTVLSAISFQLLHGVMPTELEKRFGKYAEVAVTRRFRVCG